MSKLSYQLLPDNPQTYLFMITGIIFRGQMLLYLKGWTWSNTAELTDKPAKPPSTNVATSAVVVGSSLWFHLFMPVIFIVIVTHHIVCINSSHLRLSVFLCRSLFTRHPTTVLESSCQSKGRGVPGRQHHHSTPLLNRPQKITPAFQPQQQQPMGFGQVSTLSCAQKHINNFLYSICSGCWLKRDIWGYLASINQAEYTIKAFVWSERNIYLLYIIYLILTRKQIAGMNALPLTHTLQ